MAESTLTSTYEDLRVVAGLEMGWGRSPDTHWTDTSKTDFGIACKEGYRNFLYPVCLPGENKSHNWSFLYPLGTLSLATATGITDAGTISTAWTGPDDDGNYIVSWTRSSGIWLKEHVGSLATVIHWTGDSYTATVDTWNSDTVISGTMDTNYEAGPATSFALNLLYYDLPDDFGGMVSDSFTYRRDEQWNLPQIKIVGEAEIRKVDRINDGDAYPKYASITPKKPVVASEGSGGNSTRWMVRFYPQAEQSYELEYRYHAIPPALDADTNIYHYGGAEHSQTIIAAVVDALYRRVHSSNEKSEEFHNRLKQSILHDRRNYNTGNLGQRLNYTDGRSALRSFRESTPTSNITTTFY